MKTAVCISGQMQTFRENREAYENILKTFERSEGDIVDVYIHTWNKVGIRQFDPEQMMRKHLEVNHVSKRVLA